MSKAAELAALIGSQSALSNRNLIINGAMQVAQRGTSTSSISSGDTYPSVDRFMLRVSSAGTWTHSQSTDAPAGFSSSLKMDCTAADSSLAADDNIQVQYRFEGQDLQQLDFGSAGAKSLTLSFWIKATKTGTNIAALYQDDGNDHIAKSYTVDSADTWEHKTITFSGNTLASIANDNTRGLIVQFFLAAGSNHQSGTLATSWAGYVQGNEAVGQVNHADSTSNDWYITGIQLEIGEQDTPFEHRSFGDNLAACQRYYYQIKSPTAFTRYAMSTYDTATDYSALIPFPIEMRSTPTMSTTGTASNYSIYALNSNKTSNAVPSLGAGSPFNAKVNGATASSTAGAAGVLLDNDTVDTFLGFSAEL